jgi:CheY-like chemotaxis protein
MTATRKILFADPDPASLRELAPVLREAGYQVHVAPDGSRALQVAILRAPDLVIFDEQMPLVDAQTFLRILRSNPRTDRIPVVLAGRDVRDGQARVGAWLRKPYQATEVLARVEQILRRAEASRAAAPETRELEGNLAQIPLVDLLQILSVNHKTGRLRVERDGERGELVLSEGRPVDAEVGAATGEKAVYRLLARREGQFSFQPGPVPAEGRIRRRLDELLLEGLRQADEMARLLPELPAPGERVELSPGASELPAGLHPVTEQVARLLESPCTLQQVLDATESSDLEAARAVAALLEHGFAMRTPAPAPPPAEVPLLAPDLQHALRLRIGRAQARGGKPVGKVILAGGGALERRAALARFATLRGWEPVDGALPGPESRGGTLPEDGAGERIGFGTVGSLDLGEVRVDVLALPGDRSQRPLWRPFASGAVGALVLLPAEGLESLLQELTRGLRLPVVVSGPQAENVPAVLRDAPAGMAYEGNDAAEALRALLAGAGVRRPGYTQRG